MTLDLLNAPDRPMLHALRRRSFVATAFAFAVAATLWLLVEVATGLLGWSGRGPEPLAPWMTVGYVGRTEGVDPRLIDATAGFPTPEEAGHPLTLAEIAQRRGVAVEDVYSEVESALAQLRPEHGHRDHGGGAAHGEQGGAAAEGDPPAEEAGP